MAKFQVKLAGEFQDYESKEDKVLKRAFLSGAKCARYTLNRKQYEVNFAKMVQKNTYSGKEREIRPPHKMKGKAPQAPIVPAGPTMCVKVQAGWPGTTQKVPHPRDKSLFIAVNVPPSAKVGQAMLVPVLDLSCARPSAPPPEEVAATSEETDTGSPGSKGSKGWSTGAKVAAGVGVVGLAVGGAILGEHIAEEGWDATMEDLGDLAETAGEGIADGAEAVADWTADAADTTGDFIMDLF